MLHLTELVFFVAFCNMFFVNNHGTLTNPHHLAGVCQAVVVVDCK